MANLSDKTTTVGVPDASPTQSGLVTTGTQSFAGAKDFTGDADATHSFTISNGDAGASAFSKLAVTSDAKTAELQIGSAATGSGTFLRTDDANGLFIRASNASGSINLQTGGTATRLQIDNSGNFDFQSGDLFTNGQVEIISGTAAAYASLSATPADYQLLLQAEGGSNNVRHALGFRSSSGDVLAAINPTDEGASGRTGLMFCVDDTTGLYEAMRLNSNGRVGIGTTDATAELNLVPTADLNGRAIRVADAGNGDLFQVRTGGSGDAFLQLYDASHSDTILMTAGDGNGLGPELRLKIANNNTTDVIGTIKFGNNADNDLCRIEGQTQVTNTTSDLMLKVSDAGTLQQVAHFRYDGITFLDQYNTSAAASVLYLRKSLTGTDTQFIRCTAAGANLGGIQRSGTSSTPAFYSGASDARVKTNIQDMPSTLDRLVQVELKTFDYIDTKYGEQGYGPIAQQLNTLFPNKVMKTDDGQGNSLPSDVEPWTVTVDWDYELLKGMQELYAQVQELKAEVDALKNV